MHHALCCAQKIQTRSLISWAYTQQSSQHTIIKQQKPSEDEKCCGKKKSLRSNDNYLPLVFFLLNIKHRRKH